MDLSSILDLIRDDIEGAPLKGYGLKGISPYLLAGILDEMTAAWPREQQEDGGQVEDYIRDLLNADPSVIATDIWDEAWALVETSRERWEAAR